MAFVELRSRSDGRQYYINTDIVGMIRSHSGNPLGKGRCTLVMKNGDEIELAETYQEAVALIRNAMGQKGSEDKPDGGNETPIEALRHLTKSQRLRLKTCGYDTVEKVDAASDDELRQIKSFGPSCICRVRNAVNEYKTKKEKKNNEKDF